MRRSDTRQDSPYNGPQKLNLCVGLPLFLVQDLRWIRILLVTVGLLISLPADAQLPQSPLGLKSPKPAITLGETKDPLEKFQKTFGQRSQELEAQSVEMKRVSKRLVSLRK